MLFKPILWARGETRRTAVFDFLLHIPRPEFCRIVIYVNVKNDKV